MLNSLSGVVVRVRGSRAGVGRVAGAVLALVLLAPAAALATGGADSSDAVSVVWNVDYTLLSYDAPASPDAPVPKRGYTYAPVLQQRERAALVALYNATGGSDWVDNTNWNTSQPVWDWHGVTVDSRGSVVELVLSDNGLVGSIPSSLGDLTNLHRLSLRHNDLSGQIPAQLGDLANLRVLDLGGNGLEGSIPPALGNLEDLLRLDLVNNHLESSIPSRLGRLANLKQLILFGNALVGPLPDLSGLVALEWLSLNANQFSGAVPAQLFELPALAALILSNNRFDSIPEIPVADPGEPHSLKTLNLDHNALRGEIPASLGRLTNLIELYLWGNELSGPIPAQLGDLNNLRDLDLGNNDLSGEIPAALGGLADLVGLGLTQNDLTGPIPPQLGRLARLELLHLTGNDLSGPIPPELGNLRALKKLWLGINNLSGIFPHEIGNDGNPQHLVSLKLAFNNVTGCVPSALNRDTTTVAFNTGLGFCDSSLTALSVGVRLGSARR